MAELNLDVNQFPTLTYNFLDINRTHLQALVDSSCDCSENELPSGVNVKKISGLNKACASIETGCGKNFDAAFDSIVSENKITSYQYDVASDKCVQAPVKVQFNGSGQCGADVFINACSGSSSSFIFQFDGNPQVFGVRFRICAGENAKVSVSTVNLLGKNTVYFNSIGSSASDGANVQVIQIELGGKTDVTGNFTNLNGRASSTDNDFAYVTNTDQSLDINYVVHQTGKNTSSTMNVNGIVNGNGKKTWRGTIDFINGCRDSVGDEREDVLLLSPDVVNKSLPVILCDEEAVEGSHAASIGKLSRDMLFYMQSRGVDEKTAETILTKAKVMSVASKIGDQVVFDKIQNYLDEAF